MIIDSVSQVPSELADFREHGLRQNCESVEIGWATSAVSTMGVKMSINVQRIAASELNGHRTCFDCSFATKAGVHDRCNRVMRCFFSSENGVQSNQNDLSMGCGHLSAIG